MKQRYLLMTLAGTLLPNIFVVQESLASGNWLLYRRPLDTLQAMYTNFVTSAFITDLLILNLFFMGWTWMQHKQEPFKGLGWVWLYTFAFGLSGGLPLYLYLQEKRKA